MLQYIHERRWSNEKILFPVVFVDHGALAYLLQGQLVWRNPWGCVVLCGHSDFVGADHCIYHPHDQHLRLPPLQKKIQGKASPAIHNDSFHGQENRQMPSLRKKKLLQGSKKIIEQHLRSERRAQMPYGQGRAICVYCPSLIILFPVLTPGIS